MVPFTADNLEKEIGILTFLIEMLVTLEIDTAILFHENFKKVVRFNLLDNIRYLINMFLNPINSIEIHTII